MKLENKNYSSKWVSFYNASWVSYATIFYFVISMVVFAQYTLAGSLPGDLDSIANLGAFLQFKIYLQSLWTGTSTGIVNYPYDSKPLWLYIGGNVGLTASYFPFGLLFSNQIFAFNFFISLIFTFNAVAFSLWLSSFVQNRFLLTLSGLLILLSHYTFASLDSINILFQGFVFLSFKYFFSYVKLKDESNALKAIVFAAFTVYFAPYLFFYTLSFLALGFVLSDFSQGLSIKFLKVVFKRLTVLIVCLIPFLFVLISSKPASGYINFVKELNAMPFFSLNPPDLFKSLPGSLAVFHQNVFNNPFFTSVRSCNLGIAWWIFFFLGLKQIPEVIRKYILLMIGLGFMLALGPELCFDNQATVPLPGYLIYKTFGMESFLRIPVRAYFMVVWATAFCIPYAFQNKQKVLWMFGLTVLLFVENIPVKHNFINHKKLLFGEEKWVDYLRGFPPASKLIVHLPSCINSYDGDRREYINVVRQVQHRQNMLNGFATYYPQSRVQTNQWMCNLNIPGHLDTLLSLYSVNYIVFDFNSTGSDTDSSVVCNSKNLKLILRDKNIGLFEVRN